VRAQRGGRERGKPICGRGRPRHAGELRPICRPPDPRHDPWAATSRCFRTSSGISTACPPTAVWWSGPRPFMRHGHRHRSRRGRSAPTPSSDGVIEWVLSDSRPTRASLRGRGRPPSPHRRSAGGITGSHGNERVPLGPAGLRETADHRPGVVTSARQVRHRNVVGVLRCGHRGPTGGGTDVRPLEVVGAVRRAIRNQSLRPQVAPSPADPG
jgi:hypothetical protein